MRISDWSSDVCSSDLQSEVHELIATRLAPIVRSWEFEPATADGQPAPTQTGLLIHILADELADGSVAMRLADARTGPTALTLAPPSYPMDAVRRGVEATVTVTGEGNGGRSEEHRTELQSQ